MKLTDKEKITMHQCLDRFCDGVDIDQDNGAIRVDIAGNLIEVSPNRYGELEFRTDSMLSNDTHEVNKIMIVLEYLNDYMGRHKMNVSAKRKLSINLKAANLAPGDVIQLYENDDYPLNYFQVGHISKPDGTPQLTMNCLDNGFILGTSNKIDDLIYMLITYLKAHHHTNIPEDFYRKYSSIRSLIEEEREEY
ncbi:hypothetical protein [Lactobacillus helveticus]|uniref:Uncharacterized protein n=1 Tax=Lactobacillus helveticus CIRM-BIA 953 TaxID=1226335 RepID=U4QMR8_LACHE|nr:hypothetical protein [Lactobacillus helveticus]CDI43267.1 Protein of unknown function [Lactobacillus helveticus CIRM-BIA 953]CDI43349.1 Protein of unknown function [Lactobacillus helveticus CIRM-BIA 953]